MKPAIWSHTYNNRLNRLWNFFAGSFRFFTSHLSGVLLLAGALLVISAIPASGRMPPTRPAAPPDYAADRMPVAAPFIILGAGDTTWIEMHTSGIYCPGDPADGHGGEAKGGPDGTETWCFEQDWPDGDSCGTRAPWDVRCFNHYDVRALPSQVGINYWHTSDYRTTQRSYCGDSCLWCGSGELWNGEPVECGTWVNAPGYGNQWNCIVELELPGTFDVANGCTLFFDPRYDTECKYDYFYVEFFDGTQWQTLASFNATSNNPGDECGDPSGGNPDYWGNTDTDRLSKCNWQTRSHVGEPAFVAEIDEATYSYTAGPKFRWRFESDSDWSDADGNINTDGAAFVDNVWVHGDYQHYIMDFESGLDPYWSFQNPDGVIDQWHMVHDPDPPYEGSDGGDRSTCRLDSSVVYRGRPEAGYPAGQPWRNGWFYRLVTPAFPILNTGCLIQYDQYVCTKENGCDYFDSQVRLYDSDSGTWCPWINLDGFVENGGCTFWDFDRNEDATPFYTASHDSVRFGFDLLDISKPGDFCRGKHTRTDHLIDNVSVGFFDGNATVFMTRDIDLMHDTYFTNLCGYNSQFSAYDPDTVNYYAYEAHPYPVYSQFIVEVTDKDNVQAVEILGSRDDGASWVALTMNMSEALDPQHPERGGTYYGTLCPTDFGISEWDTGTEVWYYVKCTDQLSNEAYFPVAADPGSSDHTGTRDDYFTFSILPMYPDYYSGVRLLLVDGFMRTAFDYAQCFSSADNRVPLKDIYESVLTDAGYCWDSYDIGGAGASEHIHYLCTWNADYDAVIWLTGPYYSDFLFDAEAQREMRNYLAIGGKVVLCGDRIAYNIAPEAGGGGGHDSLGGEFLSGVLGCDYIEEMDSPFNRRYIYCEGVSSVDVFGMPTQVDFDEMVIYRECPYLKDMSWVQTETVSPPAGYYAQPLLTVLNPDVPNADMVIYSEYQDTGQSVFINFDLSACINHESGYCDGSAPDGYEGFVAGNYEGRVELMLLILQDILGLPSTGYGSGGTYEVPEKPERPAFRWALHQNSPNPVAAQTHIRYEVARTSHVTIKVYNAMGRLVGTLVDERTAPGRYAVQWNGRTAGGEPVASGVYFYKMEAGGFCATRKMLVVR